MIEPCKEETEDQIRETATNVLSHNLGLTLDETQFETDKCNCLGQLRDGKQRNIICFWTTRSLQKKTNKNKKNKNETFTYQEKHGVSQLCAKAYSKLAGS